MAMYTGYAASSEILIGFCGFSFADESSRIPSVFVLEFARRAQSHRLNLQYRSVGA
jgi:exonuclease V gamma subunit